MLKEQSIRSRSRFTREPRIEELRAFVDWTLSTLDRHLREPDVIDEAIREHREMWVMLYRASSGLDARDSWSGMPAQPPLVTPCARDSADG